MIMFYMENFGNPEFDISIEHPTQREKTIYIILIPRQWYNRKRLISFDICTEAHGKFLIAVASSGAFPPQF